MSKAIWNFSYKLKKGVTQEDFIRATEKLHDGIISKAQGFISWEQYLQGDTWTDLVVWETAEDATHGTTIAEGSDLAKNFYAMIQMNTCKALVSTLVKKYETDCGLI